MINQHEQSKKLKKEHALPDWYNHAKLGIFIHWGLYSVPAFAVVGQGTVNEMISRKGIKYFYTNNCYAEWYLNSIRIENSPARQYHNSTFGQNFTYEEFASIFNEKIKAWKPNEWADLFLKVGARYAVLTSKHHDGFCLFPSQYPNPNIPNYEASRNIVGELKNALELKKIKLGLYYSGALDWSFTEHPILEFKDLVNNGPISSEYVKYADNHWKELIDTYQPWILWNDIGYPPNTKLWDLFGYYYNRMPEGVVNDRWIQFNRLYRFGVSLWAINKIASFLIQHYFIKKATVGPPLTHFDFRTPEYSVFHEKTKFKWELTRGIGNSFGYNQFETEQDYISAEELIRMFIDIVSKNGNMLINIGPMADGTIPEIQKRRLLEFGEWLKVNGEGLFDTTPWIRAEATATDGTPIRFTMKNQSIYIFLLTAPKSPSITIKNMQISSGAKISMIDPPQSLSWNQQGNQLSVSIPSDLPKRPAYALRIE